MGDDTKSIEYSNRLERIQLGRLKHLARPINPYRWNIRRLCSGRVLDIGCGIGRNLSYLGSPENVGVDHNAESVNRARRRGHVVLTDTDFLKAQSHERVMFDTILVSHVLEHMTTDEALSLLAAYLPFLNDRGRIVLICPQEKGYRSDVTHVTYFDEDQLRELVKGLDYQKIRYKSFPFPASFGNLYIYNEHVLVISGVSTQQK